MFSYTSIIFSIVTIAYCAGIGDNGEQRTKRDTDTSVGEVSQSLETERRKLIREKFDIVAERPGKNERNGQRWNEYEKKWEEYGKKWAAYDARKDSERTLLETRNKRNAGSDTGDSKWDAIGQKWNARGQQWNEYGRKWETYGDRWNAEREVQGKRNKRGAESETGDVKWDAIGQKWKAYGQEWNAYGKKWDEFGKKNAGY